MHQSTDRIVHTRAFVIPVLEHWLEQEIAQWVHREPLHLDQKLYHRAECRSYMYVCVYIYTHTHTYIHTYRSKTKVCQYSITTAMITLNTQTLISKLNNIAYTYLSFKDIYLKEDATLAAYRYSN